MFQQTPRMSTYLVAFVVGPLKGVSTSCEMPAPGQNVEVGVWATTDK